MHIHVHVCIAYIPDSTSAMTILMWKGQLCFVLSLISCMHGAPYATGFHSASLPEGIHAAGRGGGKEVKY